MIMKRLIILIAAAALSVGAMAQAPSRGGSQGAPRPDHQAKGPDYKKQQQDRIQAEKVAYITAQLDLSAAEAEKFWPVYNNAQAEQKEAGKAVGEAFKALKKAVDEGVKGDELNKLIKEYTKAREAKPDVMCKYADQFIKVLGPEKAAKLYLCEDGFRRQQIGRLGDHRGQGGQSGRPSRPGEGRPGGRPAPKTE